MNNVDEFSWLWISKKQTKNKNKEKRSLLLDDPLRDKNKMIIEIKFKNSPVRLKGTVNWCDFTTFY